MFKRIITLLMVLAIPVTASALITDNNIAPDAQIQRHKLNLGGQETGAKIFYVGTDGTQAYELAITRVDGGMITTTIDAAINKTVADRGDIIYVLQNHNEGITAASAIDVDVNGISIIGLGSGSSRPTIDYDNAAASLLIDADNVTIENIRFRASANAITTGIDFASNGESSNGAEYATIRNCEFGFAETATDEFATAIKLTNDSNYALIENNWFDGGQQAAVAAIDISNDTNGVTVRGNTIIGDYSTANILGSGVLSTNVLIQDNILWNGGTTGLNTEPCIQMLTGTVGLSKGNFCAANLANAAAAFVGDGIFNFGNWYGETADGAYTGVELGSGANDSGNITSVTAAGS